MKVFLGLSVLGLLVLRLSILGSDPQLSILLLSGVMILV
jgi:uncharacterized membrane protein